VRYIAKVVTFLFVLSTFLPLAFGQPEAGSITGTVTDPSGAVVAGAVVTVKNLDTNAVPSTRSSVAGIYTVVGLAPATYQVTATAHSH